MKSKTELYQEYDLKSGEGTWADIKPGESPSTMPEALRPIAKIFGLYDEAHDKKIRDLIEAQGHFKKGWSQGLSTLGKESVTKDVGQPPLGEIASLYGGQLPFQPMMQQRPQIIPTPDELHAYQREEQAGRLLPLQQPLQPGQMVGRGGEGFDPLAPSAPLQSSIVGEALKGQIVSPNQPFAPPSLLGQGKAPAKLDTDLVEAIGEDGKPTRILVNKQTGEIMKTGIPGKPPTGPLSVTNVNAFTPASQEAQKKFIDSSRTTYDQLKSAPMLLQNIKKAKELIPSAKGFMGTGGETLLEAAKFLNNRLGMSINTAGIKSAEELRSRIFVNIMENLKKMDAQPSQMQQLIMMESLGKLGTDPNALGAVLDAYGDTVRGKIELYNTEVTSAEERGVKFPYNPVIKLPESLKAAQEQQAEAGTVAPFHDAEKEKRYQEFKKKHK